MGAREIAGRVLRWRVLLCVGIALITAAALPSVAAAATFSVSYENPPDFMWANGFAPDAPVTVTLDDPSTGPGVDQTYFPTTDSTGFFSLGPIIDFDAGWTITMNDGVTTKEHVVIPMGFDEVDPVTDTCWGYAAPNSTVHVGFEDYDLDIVYYRDVTTDGTGAWQADFSVPVLDGLGGNAAGDIKITTGVNLTQSDSDGDATQTNGQPDNPQIWVSLNDDNISAHGWIPGSNVEIYVDDPATPEPIDYSTNFATNSQGTFWPTGALPYDFKVGDVVSAVSGMQTTELTIEFVQIDGVDLDNDSVWGLADPGASVWVDSSVGDHGEAIADETGAWVYFSGNDFAQGTFITAHRADEDMDRSQVNHAVPNPRFGVDPTIDHVMGWEWPANTTVSVYVDAGYVGSTGTDDWGNFNFNSLVDVTEGSVVMVTDGILEKTTIVTALTLTDVNPETDTISGTAAPGSYVHVWVHGMNPAHRLAAVDGEGNWVADFSVAFGEDITRDLVPGDSGNANQEDADADQTVIHWNLTRPNFGVDPDTDELFGADWARGSSVTISIDDPGTPEEPDFQTTADTDPGWGNFGVWLGDQYDIQPGFNITVTDGDKTALHTVAALTITSVDPDADTVSGTGPVGEWLSVYPWDSPTSRQVQVDGEGNWLADFSVAGDGEQVVDIVPGAMGEADWNDAENDFTRVIWSVPNPTFAVEYDQDEIFGGDWERNAQISITIDDASNGVGVDFETSATSDDWGSFDSWFGGEFDVDVGDTVTVSDGVRQKDHLVLHVDTTGADADLDLVWGWADPGAEVRVAVYDYDVSKTVTADGGGYWYADFATGEPWETADLMLGNTGASNRIDEDGDSSQSSFRIAAPSFAVRPEENAINGWDFAPNQVAHITIDDIFMPGTVDYEQWVPVDDWGGFEWWWDPAEFQVAAGQVVTVECDGVTKTHIVTAVVVTELNADTDVVAGTAEPGTWVDVYIYEGAHRYVEVDGAGNWAADFTEPDGEENAFDLAPGNNGVAQQADEDGDQTQDQWHIANPMLGVDPDTNEVFGGDFQPGALVNISIDDPGTPQSPDYEAGVDADWDWGSFETFTDWFDIQPGFVVTVSDGVSVREHVVAAIAVTAIDTELDTISGTGPAGEPVVVWFWDDGATRYVVADGEGNWTADFSVAGPDEWVVDLQKGSSGEVRWSDGDGDYTRHMWHVPNPNFTVEYGSDALWGGDWLPLSTVTIQVDVPGVGTDVDFETTAEVSDWGDFWAGLEGEFDLDVGHIVTVTDGTNTKQHEVLHVQITNVDADLDTVTGTSDPNVWVRVELEGWGIGRDVFSDSNGDWMADFSAGEPWEIADIAPGIEVGAYRWDEDGDSSRALFYLANPSFVARPLDNSIGGWDFPALGEVYITVDDPDTPDMPDFAQLLQADEWGSFETWWDPAEFQLEPGQLVTVEADGIMKQLIIAPLSVTGLDVDADIMTGTADPDAWVSIMHWGFDDYGVPADGLGDWVLNDIPLHAGSEGNVMEWDQDGDATEVYWRIADPTIAVDVVNGSIWGWEFTPMADVTVTLDDPDTPASPDQTLIRPTDEGGYFNLDDVTYEMQPGLTIGVTDGSLVKELVVVDLAVTSVDPDTDIVAGTVSPDSTVWCDAWTKFDGQSRSVLSAGGQWEFDFSQPDGDFGPLDLEPNNDGQAYVDDADGDMTIAPWHIPRAMIRANPAYEELSGSDWPADAELIVTYDDPATPANPDLIEAVQASPIGDFVLPLGPLGVDIKTGDTILVSDGEMLKGLTVSTLRVNGIDVGADLVFGEATPDSTIWVSIDDSMAGLDVLADGAGGWTADFTWFDAWDILSSTTGQATEPDEDGDETVVPWNAAGPYFTVMPESDSIMGWEWAMPGVATVSIDDPGTVPNPDWTQDVPTAEWWGTFNLDSIAYDIKPGDVVTVDDGTTAKTHTVTDVHVLGANIATEVVYGTASTGDVVYVGYFNSGWMGFVEVPIVGGEWAADFSVNDPPIDLTLGMSGAANQPDADGDTTEVGFTILNPVAVDDSATATEDTLLSVPAPGVLANDTYNPGETYISVQTQPAHGELTIDVDTGAWTYTPDPNYNGADSFTYVLAQDDYETEAATVSITVTPADETPVAVNDSATATEDTQLSVPAPGVLANDTYTAGGTEIVVDTQPTHGTLILNSTTGAWTYMPDADYNGADSFTYHLSEGAYDSPTATVSITVTPVAETPVAVNDSATATEDTQLSVPAPGVLGNDTYTAGVTTIVVDTQPTHGTLVMNTTTGAWIYTPAANYAGADSFTYRLHEGAYDSPTATVSITVTAVNDAPTAVPDSYAVDQDAVLTVSTPGVLANDSDVEGSSLTAAVVTDPAHGVLNLLANGGFTYTPSAGWSGTDTFTYTASDGSASSTPALVTITVSPAGVIEVPINGTTRFDTSVAISQQAFPEGADWVVVATGRNWPDALGGSALAGALGGPILLTDTSALPGSVVDEIDRLGATDAIILGGTNAIHASVEAELNLLLGDANVERIWGSSRYATADAVAVRTIAELGEAYDGTALMATGTNYPDALGAAPLAAGLHWPLYLTQATGISASTELAMEGVDEVLVLGGTSAIPAKIESDLVLEYGDPNVTRLAGGNRYSTAVAIATHGVANGLGWDRLAIATGMNFPDALAGGVLQGRDGSVMLLTPSNSLDMSVAAVLEANKAQINEVRYLGGLNAINQSVRDDVMAILE